MNIGEYSVNKKVISWLIVILLVGGGVSGFDEMGKLEDPNFTIKKAKIITHYPGATAQQTQDEVTYHIEEAIQRMPQLKRIKMSISRPGYSDIKVEFKDSETLIGYTSGYSPGRVGFFVFPADPEDNNEKVFVVTAATKDVSFL